jgi:hypothetical protein
MTTSNDRTMNTIIPAAPGWYVALFVPANEHGPAWLSDHPIVAWDIERSDGPIRGQPGERWSYREATPVLLDGDFHRYGNQRAIKAPDGKYYTADGPTLSNEAEAIAYFTEEQEAAAKSAIPKVADIADVAIHRQHDGCAPGVRPTPRHRTGAATEGGLQK